MSSEDEMPRGLICTYCDAPATTKDHVPPKLLFPPPRETLVTVPACESCNGRFGKDDEYARLVLSVDHRTGDDDSVERLWPSVMQSLQRPQAQGFRRLLTNTLRPTLFQKASGLIIPTGVFEADLTRLKNWTSRIARGLYRHTKGQHLPLDVHVRSVWEDDLRDMPPEVREDFGKKTIHHVVKEPEHVMQQGDFRYRLLTLDEDQHSGMILMTFYGSLHGLVLFQSPEARAAAKNT